MDNKTIHQHALRIASHIKRWEALAYNKERETVGTNALPQLYKEWLEAKEQAFLYRRQLNTLLTIQGENHENFTKSERCE